MDYVIHLTQRVESRCFEMENDKNILEVRNLKINFNTYAGTVKAIRDVSFDLRKGETLAIVGESGSGKTVTTRSIMGLNSPNAVIDGGTIMFKNQDLLKKNKKANGWDSW